MFSHSDRSCFEALDFNHWFLTSRQLHAVSGLHFWIFFSVLGKGNLNFSQQICISSSLSFIKRPEKPTVLWLAFPSLDEMAARGGLCSAFPWLRGAQKAAVPLLSKGM